MRLDANWLRNKGACSGGITRFMAAFPEGLDITGEPDIPLLSGLARRSRGGGQRPDHGDIIWLECVTIREGAGEAIWVAIVPEGCEDIAVKDAGWLAILVAIWRHLAAQD